LKEAFETKGTKQKSISNLFLKLPYKKDKPQEIYSLKGSFTNLLAIIFCIYSLGLQSEESSFKNLKEF
jgi:hypothetical protein